MISLTCEGRSILHTCRPIRRLENRQKTSLLHWIRSTYYGRLYYVPSLRESLSPLRRNLPHHLRRLLLRRPLQRPIVSILPDPIVNLLISPQICQRSIRYCPFLRHRSNSHVRQHWRSNLNMGFFTLRWSKLSYREWIESCYEFLYSRDEYFIAFMDG